ncbi:hypothetical protein PIB30_016289 [Stylosanthes scabra]|uniref:Transposase (putative) gypsy type domain-containing protein n=1 Tax=Stylosanthes scabra TaxID=79078 RepID=A0ABU6Q7V4_9FABA|nr:hypothetical protein [Stylosanthes scabra]
MAVNRQTDENGKLVVPIAVEDWYSWVKGEVREMASLFVDLESIEELGEPSMFVRGGSVVKLRFLPCGVDDRVYHRGEGWEYFYMYTTVFIDVGIKFPFSEFECGVLNQLKCAPTQIHQNAWAFVRGFEILMEYLGIDPLLEVFFSFFQAKGVRKGGLVTLNSVQGKALFGLYRQSYKDFKEMFVKVTCSEDQFPFYLDEYGLERFPLYWYSEPVQILGMNKVNKESLEIIEFLESRVCTKELLSLTMVFKWDKEREWRRAEEGGSSKKVIDLTSAKWCGKEVSLEEVKRSTERQKPLHGYVGEEDLTLVWSEHFPMSVVAEEHFQSKMDLELLGSVDDKTRAQFMQVCATWLLCLGRFEELKANSEAEKKKEESSWEQKKLELERELEAVKEQNTLKDKELLEMKTDNEQLKGKLQKLDKEKTELRPELLNSVCKRRKPR